MKTFICGHRNPDTDSIMSAYALADLRRRTGMTDVEPICAGRIPDKAAWVFKHFNLEPIKVRRDVYVRVRDLVDNDTPMIEADAELLSALKTLAVSGESSLPVKDKAGKFIGMLSPAKLLNLFIEKADLTIPVSEAPLYNDSQLLNGSDRVHDVKKAAIRNLHNHFPVVDDSGKLLGCVLKRAFAEEPPYRMILVDHNEIEQGIPGLEELPIIEVVDHHRIAFAETKSPIKYTADVVGSTCTLVARMYRAAGERPSKGIAGALLAGIVSDTLMFQSPTATEDDRAMSAWLEKLSGESAAEVMNGLMSVDSPLTTMSAEKAIASDAKTYHDGGRRFILAQVEESNMAVFHRHLGELRGAMEIAVKGSGLDFMALMVTDPVRGNSELLFLGDEAVRRSLPYRRSDHGTFLMPGVLSRKKQLLPEVLAALG